MAILISFLHFLALLIGSAGIVVRIFGLKENLERSNNLEKIYFGDNLWGLAALVWIVTGLVRVFGDFDKGSQYYLTSHWFYLKMSLFALIFVLEIYPMITLIKWRMRNKQDLIPNDLAKLRVMYKLSLIELSVLVFIPLCATIMARGGL